MTAILSLLRTSSQTQNCQNLTVYHLLCTFSHNVPSQTKTEAGETTCNRRSHNSCMSYVKNISKQAEHPISNPFTFFLMAVNDWRENYSSWEAETAIPYLSSKLTISKPAINFFSHASHMSFNWVEQLHQNWRMHNKPVTICVSRKWESKRQKADVVEVGDFSLSGVNLANKKEKGAGEERVTERDGWRDTEHQGEWYIMLCTEENTRCGRKSGMTHASKKSTGEGFQNKVQLLWINVTSRQTEYTKKMEPRM